MGTCRDEVSRCRFGVVGSVCILLKSTIYIMFPLIAMYVVYRI